MENTLENKAKFFAQHWGQDNILNGNQILKHQAFIYMDEFSKFFLELKPLPSITDEDFLAVMWKQFPFQPTFKKGKMYHEHLNIIQADFLRSKGYALPWMGLSVEKLVSYGWVKLKEATNEQ